MKLKKNNLIVTGLPRSGTTLTTALLNQLSNSVCISEPGWQGGWLENSRNEHAFVERLANDYNAVRKKIIHGQPVRDKVSIDGLPLTNYYKRQDGKKSEKNFETQPITYNIDSHDFLLGMKHNAQYTSVLPFLANSNLFSFIYIIRHPIPTIMSWRSMGLALRVGKVPEGAHFWPELKQINNSQEEILKKQVMIYNLFCERYWELKDKGHILKYEDIVSDPSVLETITGLTYTQKINIEDQNKSPYYNWDEMDQIKDMLVKHAPYALKFYSMNDL